MIVKVYCMTHDGRVAASTVRPIGTLTTGGKAGIDPTSFLRADHDGPLQIEELGYRHVKSLEGQRYMGYGDDFKFVEYRTARRSGHTARFARQLAELSPYLQPY